MEHRYIYIYIYLYIINCMYVHIYIHRLSLSHNNVCSTLLPSVGYASFMVWVKSTLWCFGLVSSLSLVMLHHNTLENQLCHLDILQKSSNRPGVAWLIGPESAMVERSILTNGPLELRFLSLILRRSKNLKNLKKLLRQVRGIQKNKRSLDR